MIDPSIVEDYFKKSIVYLSEHTDANRTIRLNDLYEVLNITKEYRQAVHDKLRGGLRYIDGRPHINNPEIWINHRGRKLAEEILEQIERDKPKQFAKNCDKVLKYLLESEKETFTSQQVADAVGLSINTIDIIAEEFEERKLVELRELYGGHYKIEATREAEKFAAKTSFANEFNSGRLHVNIDTILNAPGNKGTVIGKQSAEQIDNSTSSTHVEGDVTGQLTSQSSDSSFIKERTESTNTTNAIPPKTKSRISKTTKIIIAIIGAVASAIAIYEFVIKHLYWK
jgi:predicted ribonuclease YlaK